MMKPKYENRAKPKSSSVISILLLAAGPLNINHVAYIVSVIYLLREIFDIRYYYDNVGMLKKHLINGLI